MTGTGSVDLHIHTTVSDGTDTPEQLLSRVREAGIRIFSITDHDAIGCGQILPGLLMKNDPVFIPGVEFSCKDEGGKYHILGYGFDPESEAIHKTVENGCRLRKQKLKDRLEFLRSRFGFVFPADDQKTLFSMDNPGKPHLANLMVKLRFAESREQAFHEFLNKVKTPGPDYLRPELAIRGILDAGGIPVLAHPCFGSGEELILGDELEDRVRRLMEFGLEGLEAYYSDFSGKMREQVSALAARYGLYITAGSDYHGANKRIRLGETGLTQGQELPDGLTRFIRTVCGSEIV